MNRGRGFWAVFLVLCVGGLSAQDDQTLRVIHRFDWRRSVDGHYQGLVYGYLSGAWKMTPGAQGETLVDARYQVASESRRDNALTEKAIDAEKSAQFRIDAHGTMVDFHGDGVPYYRNFPAPLPPGVGPGSVWTGTGELVGDFLGTGVMTRIPILIEYRWAGPGTYGSTPVIQVKTQYALRYGDTRDIDGDPSLTRAEGTHQGVVSYDADSHQIVFIRETAQEAFTAKSGKTVANDGIILTFFEGVPALGTATVVETLKEQLPQVTPAAKLADGPGLLSGPGTARMPSDVPDVKIEADPRGVKVTLDNLKFVADQATLLPGEDQRLTVIANLLKKVPGRNLLVVGHTAAVGSLETQDTLSLDRAKSIVDQLKATGIPAQRLMYEGRGGRDPVAPNDTEAGRALNRRVEILILDQ